LKKIEPEKVAEKTKRIEKSKVIKKISKTK